MAALGASHVPWSRIGRGMVLLAVWFVLSGALAAFLFLTSSRTIDVASHESVVRPTTSRWVVMHTGPVLPDLRMPSHSVIGIDIDLGGTEADSLDALVKRYAFIASHPKSQIDVVQDALAGMAITAGLRGAVIGLVPVVLWVVIGHDGRGLVRQAFARRSVLVGGLSLVLVAGLAFWPWGFARSAASEGESWQSLSTFAGTAVQLPPEISGLQLNANLTTQESKRLVLSAISTYQRSLAFYDTAADAVADLPIRTPLKGETVALLVSDRHDNIGMDQVARAIADAGGATVVLDAGDDTSTGSTWEAFSLDSLQERFKDFDRIAISGNHDHGDFVSSYLAKRGWVNPDGEVVGGPGGSLLWGRDDPRSSGLGNWVDIAGSYANYQSDVADAVCSSEERVGTVLVHATSLAAEVLQRGCADLVIGGHLHVQQGPERVVGTNAAVGYSYTNGTTGGAAYAIAVGSKPRREAEVTLITYRDGRPVGLQPVRLQTNGRFHVSPYLPLLY